MDDKNTNGVVTARANSQLFTVRIWQEPTSNSSILWRGKVQAVPSGAWRHFQSWDSLIAFLQEQMETMSAAVQKE